MIIIRRHPKMGEKPKDTPIQIKIDSATKGEFFRRCKEQAINPSAWLRKKIYEFLDRPIDM
jgi:hypothetical protein